MREGQGSYTTKDGLSIKGEWTGDEPMGEVEIKFPNGDHFKGSVDNG